MSVDKFSGQRLREGGGGKSHFSQQPFAGDLDNVRTLALEMG